MLGCYSVASFSRGGPWSSSQTNTLNKQGVTRGLRNEFGIKPLLLAVTNSHMKVPEMPLNTGKVDVNARDLKGKTVFYWSAVHGIEEAVKVILETCKVENFNPEDGRGETLLSHLERVRSYSIIRLLQPHMFSFQLFPL